MEKVNYSDGEFQDRDRKLKNKSTRNAENETSFFFFHRMVASLQDDP